MSKVTIPSAAADLGITASAVYAAIKRGDIKAQMELGVLTVTERQRDVLRDLLASRPRRGPKANGKRKK
jgi:hypothetical protein